MHIGIRLGLEMLLEILKHLAMNILLLLLELVHVRVQVTKRRRHIAGHLIRSISGWHKHLGVHHLLSEHWAKGMVHLWEHHPLVYLRS